MTHATSLLDFGLGPILQCAGLNMIWIHVFFFYHVSVLCHIQCTGALDPTLSQVYQTWQTIELLKTQKWVSHLPKERALFSISFSFHKQLQTFIITIFIENSNWIKQFFIPLQNILCLYLNKLFNIIGGRSCDPSNQWKRKECFLSFFFFQGVYIIQCQPSFGFFGEFYIGTWVT